MPRNTFRKPPVAPRPKRKPNPVAAQITNWINDTIGLDRLFGEDNAWPIRNINQILWVTFLLLVYIGLNHNAERLFRNVQQTRSDLDEKRATYTTLQAAFMKTGRQSELAKRVDTLGLTSASRPPYRIVVKKEEK
jgi:Bacteriodetes cell division protein (FtsL-like)